MTQISLERILADLGVEPKKVRQIFPDIYPVLLQKLIETDPKRAYWAFKDAGDQEGLSAARSRLVETDPQTAYLAFSNAGDREGLSAARSKLVETDLKTAYEAFRTAGDQEGLKVLVTSITKQTGVNPKKLERLFS